MDWRIRPCYLAPLSAPYLNLTDHYAYLIGDPDGTIRPSAPITPAETATAVNRIINPFPDKEHLLPDMVPDNPENKRYYEDVQEATSSHNCDMVGPEYNEVWTILQPNRDWAAPAKE